MGGYLPARGAAVFSVDPGQTGLLSIVRELSLGKIGSRGLGGIR